MMFFLLFNQYNTLKTDCQEKKKDSYFFCLGSNVFAATVSEADGTDYSGSSTASPRTNAVWEVQPTERASAAASSNA